METNREEMNEQIEILNVLGEIVYEKNVLCSKGSQELKLDVSMLEIDFIFFEWFRQRNRKQYNSLKIGYWMYGHRNII